MIRQLLRRLFGGMQGGRRVDADIAASGAPTADLQIEHSARPGSARSPLVNAYVGDAVYEL